MKPGRVLALILGCLLILPAIGLLLGGGALGLAAAARDDNGYVTDSAHRLGTSTAAVTVEGLEVIIEPGTPDWLLDRFDLDVSIEVTGTAADTPLFVGIAPAAEVDAYLTDVAHDQVTDISGDATDYRRSNGSAAPTPPADQTFWVASATGPGTQRLDWAVSGGRWAVVLMNADGSPGVSATTTVGARTDALVPVALTMLGVGVLISILALVLIAVGATGLGAGHTASATHEDPETHEDLASHGPVNLTARLDPGLSRWQWLVKWALAIPHFVVLTFLWLAFTLLTLVAGVAILFTGRYPAAIFDVNLGVLRWTWRVSYYATSGGLGTDRYPPFTLGPVPDYPATLDVARPARLSQRLVLVKWVLAVPQLLIVALLVGGGLSWSNGDQAQFAPLGGGLIGILALVAVVVLLFSGRYPRPLFDLIVGLNRWVYRVIAYAALMTDSYPPFRLDQGGTEPAPTPQSPPPPQSAPGEAADREAHPAGAAR